MLGLLVKIGLHIGVNVAAFWAFSNILFSEDIIINGGWKGYVIVATVFGFINTFIKPILKILTLPIRFLTLGLFSLVLNGIILWMMEAFVNFLEFADVNTQVESWFVYLVAGLILAILNAVLHFVL